MKNLIKRIALVSFMLLLVACEKRYRKFEYVELSFVDGTDTTFADCTGGIDKGLWIIITDSTRNVYPLSAIKKFDWKYTVDELIEQQQEISF